MLSFLGVSRHFESFDVKIVEFVCVRQNLNLTSKSLKKNIIVSIEIHTFEENATYTSYK